MCEAWAGGGRWTWVAIWYSWHRTEATPAPGHREGGGVNSFPTCRTWADLKGEKHAPPTQPSPTPVQTYFHGKGGGGKDTSKIVTTAGGGGVSAEGRAGELEGEGGAEGVLGDELLDLGGRLRVVPHTQPPEQVQHDLHDHRTTGGHGRRGKVARLTEARPQPPDTNNSRETGDGGDRRAAPVTARSRETHGWFGMPAMYDSITKHLHGG